MGTLFEYEGKYGAAVGAKEEALKAFRELKDSGFWMGEILSGTGHSQAMLGRSDAAQTQLAEALKLSDKLQNKALTAQILNFQGDRLFYVGDARGRAAPLRAGAPDRLEDRRQAPRAAVEGQPREDRHRRGAPPVGDRGAQEAGRGIRLARPEVPVGREHRPAGPGARRGEALPAGPAGARARAREERKARPAAPCWRAAITCSLPRCDPPATPPRRPGTSARRAGSSRRSGRKRRPTMS